MNSNQKIKFSIIAISWIFISSCASMVKSGIKENDEQIPIGFGKEDVTILAVKKSNRYNKWLEERFRENYFGKYIIINETELTDPKYKDIKKFKYIFDEEETDKKSRLPNEGAGSFTDTYVSFFLKDRGTAKIYQTHKIYGAPSALMRDYLIVLEKVRKKNMGN